MSSSLLARGRVERVVDAHDDMRCGDAARGSSRRRAPTISANGSRSISAGASLRATATRDLDGFALEPRLDVPRARRSASAEARGDAFERARRSVVRPRRRLRLAFAHSLCGARRASASASLTACSAERTRRLAGRAGGEVDVEQEFCRRAHQ